MDLPEENSSITLEEALIYPALRLFADRARAVQPDFRLNSENIKTVSAICAHLDGLPLVIELISARMRLMSPEALLNKLDEQFILTADGMRAASECQKTLSNAIAWSYSLLSAEEQKLFAYLSVFSGGFSVEEAQAIFSQAITEKPISNLVTSLLDKSLLQRASNPQTSTEPRYTMLVTIQEFARQRLQSFGEEEKARNQHLIYFLDVARKADAQLRGPKQLDGLSCLRESSDNIRVALDWAIETGQTRNALQLVQNLHWSWIILSNHTEARQWFRRVLEMPDVPSYPEIHAEVLTQMANHTFLQIAPLDAKPYAEQALSIARTHQDKHNTAWALVMLALALTDEKNFATAKAALEESQALFQEVQDEWGYGMSVNISGWSASRQEDWSVALTLMEESLTILKKLGDQYFMSVVLRGIGTVQMMQGDLPQGETAMKEALVLAHKMDSKLEIAWNMWSLGEAAKRSKRWTRAVQLYWASRNILESSGAWHELNHLDFENELPTCRAALSEAEFAEAEAQGRLMTMEQAKAYALENPSKSLTNL